MSDRPAILDRLSALADSTRTRILLVASRRELTVSELCSVLQLPQSTVSRHLKILADGDWVQSRPEGTRRLYRISESLEPNARRLWELAADEVGSTPVADEDSRRLAEVLAERRRRSQAFFAGAAEEWDRTRERLFGSSFHGTALLALLDEDCSVADLGCGTGSVAATLAPFVGQVVAVDDSPPMLEAARARLADLNNVELREGQLESLPVDSTDVDAATLVLVLHHAADPSAVLAEAARILRPDGRLVVVDMLPHDRREFQDEMGHVWLGFSREQLERLMEESGLRLTGFRPLPADLDAHGPSLFVAGACRVGAAA